MLASLRVPFLELRVEEQIIVTSYKDLVIVWLFRQPCEVGFNLGKCTPFAEVSGVKEDVAGWDGWTRAMGVRHADDDERVIGDERWGEGRWREFKVEARERRLRRIRSRRVRDALEHGRGDRGTERFRCRERYISPATGYQYCIGFKLRINKLSRCGFTSSL